MIKILSKDTIQKIAAGEVIERPFSVVKELVENSIDAKATEIKVEISEGGLNYIKVTDNGCGISKSEVEVAVKRHATSKLDNFNDLYNICSLGFRGEALASITSISKTTIETKTKDDDIGSSFIFESSQLVSRSDIAKNNGTSIIVEDLFYNIPVRKRFLNSTISESNAITSIMYRLAIGNNDIGFTYVKDDKEVFRTIKGQGLKSNLSELFGFEFTKELLEVNIDKKDFSIKGYISNNRYYRSNRSMEYIYINGRYVKNSDISNAIEKAYGSLIPNGRFPAFQLFFEIKPNLIDVNIHPNKEKVSIVILDDIKNSINKELPRILNESKNLLNLSVHDKDEEVPKLYNNDFKDLLNRYSNSYEEKDLKINSFYSTTNFEDSSNNEEDSNISDLDAKYDFFVEEEHLPSCNFSNKEIEDEEDIEIDNISYFSESSKEIKSYQYIGTIFKTYNIFQSLKENKIILMDQHAAHERINFEKFLNLYNKKEVASQQLVSPILVNVTDKEMDLYRKFYNMFYDLGFEVDAFSNDTLIIRGLPEILEIPKTGDLFTNILDRLNDDINSFDDSEIINKIISMSCKASVKSGDFMSNLELEVLLQQLLQCENPLTCPHGRPTIIEVSKNELEKLFLRVK
ncbi:DNA mismatch repair endonuclease MutL [Lagierella sp. ICN-221743]